MSGDAIDDEPSPALPSPARGRFLGQSIIHANDQSHYEHLFGFFMRNAESKFLQPRINIQRPDLQILGMILVEIEGRLDVGPFSESDDVWLGGSQGRGREKEKAECDAKNKTHPKS